MKKKLFHLLTILAVCLALCQVALAVEPTSTAVARVQTNAYTQEYTDFIEAWEAAAAAKEIFDFEGEPRTAVITLLDDTEVHNNVWMEMGEYVNSKSILFQSETNPVTRKGYTLLGHQNMFFLNTGKIDLRNINLKMVNTDNSSAECIRVTGSAHLTIENSTLYAENPSSYGTTLDISGGSATLYSGQIEAGQKTTAVDMSGVGSTFTMNGGVIDVQDNNTAVNMRGTAGGTIFTLNDGLIQSAGFGVSIYKGEITVNSGAIETVKNGISGIASSITINNCTINTAAGTAVLIEGGNATIYNGKFTGGMSVGANGDSTHIVIYDGQFHVPDNGQSSVHYALDIENPGCTGDIYGGSFYGRPAGLYCSHGCVTLHGGTFSGERFSIQTRNSELYSVWHFLAPDCAYYYTDGQPVTELNLPDNNQINRTVIVWDGKSSTFPGDGSSGDGDPGDPGDPSDPSDPGDTIRPSGTVKANTGYAAQGTLVTLTVVPDDGCRLDGIHVTGHNGESVDVTGEGNTCTFYMPDCDVTVRAVFVRN